jgi:heme/copper-type cytochrome/quinol oxidase subunit 2
MRKGTVWFLAAGVWELIRFVAVFLSSATTPATIPNAHLNLLWLAGPALVLTAVFFSSAYHPDQLRAYLPILRIGGTIAVITDAAVVITGSFDWTVAAPASVGTRVLFVLAFGVLVVDLIVASYLFAYRLPVEPVQTDPPRTLPSDDELPNYDPTDLDEG